MNSLGKRLIGEALQSGEKILKRKPAEISLQKSTVPSAFYGNRKRFGCIGPWKNPVCFRFYQLGNFLTVVQHAPFRLIDFPFVRRLEYP
jgi:hypothetical protein